jgi:acyl dehydratase
MTMPFNAGLVGREIGPVRWTATPRRILAFAAALAPDAAAVLDDLRPEGLTGLPMIIVSPEWALSLMGRNDSAQTLTPEELARGVHASQDSRFHTPIRAGDTLVSTSRLSAARASRAGVVATSVITHAREPDGAIVARTYSVSIFRGVQLAGATRGGEESESELTPVDVDWRNAGSETIVFDRGFPHIYSECAEIWNPIHTERAVALAAGLPDIIVHGTALWAAAGLRLAPAGRRLARLASRFRRPVIPGTPLQLEHVSRDDVTVFRLVLDSGRIALEGRAEYEHAAPKAVLGRGLGADPADVKGRREI